MEHINKSYPQGAVYSSPQRVSMINEEGFFETINDSLKGPSMPLPLKTEDVDATAQYLVDKFRNPGGLKFYQKTAWHIPRGTIDRLVVLAFDRGQNPGRYFTTLINKEMR